MSATLEKEDSVDVAAPFIIYIIIQ
jgi:hypothetical protein